MTSEIGTKEFLKPPFSAYDFFGYLIPAFLFLLCVYLFELPAHQFIRDYHQPLHSLLERTTPPKDAPIYVQAGFVLGFILASYVCGHILGTISSVLIDRTLVSKAHGYPPEHLLIERKWSPRRDVCENFYRGFFAWTNIFTWLIVRWAVFGVQKPSSCFIITLNAFTVVPLLLYLALSYFWPTRSEMRNETRPHGRRSQGWLYNRTLLFLNRHKTNICKSLKLYALPYNFAWWLLTRFFNWKDPFTANLRLQYQNAFLKTFGNTAAEAGTDNYWFSTFFVAEKSPVLYQMLRNWFHLYSFARNVATAFYLAFCYGALYIASVRLNGASIPESARSCFSGIICIYFTLAVLLMIRYYYLYYSYYSKNLYRAFVFISRREDERLRVPNVKSPNEGDFTDEI